MRISDWSSDVCSSDLSKPVVSVSKIISRIEALIWTLSGVETRGDEANLTARLAFGAARFDDEIGTRPLDAIGNLQAADHLQLRRGHAGAAHHAPSLHPSGRRNDRDRPELAPAALLEEQRNVEHDENARLVEGEGAVLRLSASRVNNRFQTGRATWWER